MPASRRIAADRNTCGSPVASHKQIQVAVAIIVHPGGAAAPPAGTHSSLGRHLTEGPVAIVAKELITAVARDVDIQVAVVIIVAHGHAGSEHPIACDTCFGSYILEFSVAQIAIERIARRWLAVGQVGSVGEKEVLLAVVVEIDHAHPGAEGLEHVLLGRSPVFVAKGNARLRRNFVELHPAGFAGLRSGGLLAAERQGRRGKHQQIRTEDQESFAQEQHGPGSNYICRCIASALPAGNQDFHIVSQLPGGELIAFEIGCQPASAIHHQGM